jgi:RNA-directed DNA polymerase
VTNSTAVPNPTGGADSRRCATQPALHDNLMQAVLAPENMQRAWKQVKSNKGAPGVDRISLQDFPTHARVHWPGIRQALIDGSYRPQPVRQVVIPKPGGGERMLGIPSVMEFR